MVEDDVSNGYEVADAGGDEIVVVVGLRMGWPAAAASPGVVGTMKGAAVGDLTVLLWLPPKDAEEVVPHDGWNGGGREDSCTFFIASLLGL